MYLHTFKHPKTKGPRKIFYTEYGACNAQSKRASKTHLKLDEEQLREWI